MGSVTSLLLATILFVGTHFLLSHPLRERLVARLGEGGFMIVYSLVAFTTFGWVVWAAIAMESTPPHWTAPPWFFAWVAPVLMWVASVLLAGSFIRNPAFPDPSNGEIGVRPATGVFAVTRHPMNWAFMIWAITHFILSGTPVNIILTVGIFVLTFVGSILQDRKKEALIGDSWRGWEARTSFVPFAAVLSGKIPVSALWRGWTSILLGTVIWLAASWAHTMPVGYWQWTL